MGMDGFHSAGFPIADNEKERLEEILAYDFEDDGPQENLDMVCMLAQSMFNVPFALITLIGRDQQTFIGKCGVSADGTPRRDAFCNHTILDDEVLVVNDATNDRRFQNNPVVTGDMHIRFYAGAPLTVRPGVRIGALCLVDQEPREFSPADAAKLQMLAGLAINELRRRRVMIDLKRQSDLKAQTARLTRVGSWIMDIPTQAITWSDQTYRIFDLDPTTIVSLETLPSFWAPESQEQMDAALADLVQYGTPIDCEFAITTAKGNHRWLRCLSEAEMLDGVVMRVTGSVQDITEQHEHAAQIEKLAFRDSLTGLPNRALFQDRFEAAVNDAQRRGSKVRLIILDLDHFKDVNDTLGHDAGDALLRSVSARMESVYRRSDTVARLGGDEFAVILPDIHDLSDLTKPTEKLMELLRHPVEHQGKSLAISASVGSSIYPEDDSSAAQLMKNADIALYRAKGGGRNRLVTFEPAMRTEVDQRVALTQEIRTAIQRKEFILYYQPLVNIATHTVTGFEALMRWAHPSRGILTPDKFLVAFEDQELSLSLGEHALDSAMQQIRMWMDQHLEFGRIAVNLSASQFRTGNLAETVAKKLRHWGVPASRLTLEVTENVYMGWGADIVGDTIRALHDTGILIALDDFGTGYASLTNLKQFPIDRLKIDKSFVQNGRDEAIVQAVLTMGASMGMKVVAEGVETQEQLASLNAMGCDQAQGYLFSKPMPGSNVSTFLRDFAASGRQSRAVA